MRQLPNHIKTLMPTLLLLLVGVIVIMALLGRCSESQRSSLIGSAADVPSQGDTIDVAIDFSPISYFVDGDSISGFNHDLLQLISHHTKLPIKFHPVTSIDNAIAGLGTGLYDIVAADIPVTLEDKNHLLFTEPVYLDRQVLVEHIDPKSCGQPTVSSQLDLGGKEIWVMSDSPSESRLRNLSAEIGDTIYVKSSPDYSAELLFLMTSIGEIDYCVINEKVAKALVEKNGTAKISTNISFTQFQAWALSIDNEPLKAKIDSALTIIKSTPTYDKLTRRYLK